MKFRTATASLIAAIGIAGLASPALASSGTTTDAAAHRAQPISMQYAQSRPETNIHAPLKAEQVRPETNIHAPLKAEAPRPETNIHAPLKSETTGEARPETNIHAPLKAEQVRPETNIHAPLK